MRNRTIQIMIVIIAIIFILIIVMNWKKWFGTGTSTGTDTGTSTGTGFDAKAIADRLYELMKGLTLLPSSRDEVVSLLKQVSELIDENFIAVWKAFGNRDGNLAEWAADEYYVDNYISESIKNRANMLGLK